MKSLFSLFYFISILKGVFCFSPFQVLLVGHQEEGWICEYLFCFIVLFKKVHVSEVRLLLPLVAMHYQDSGVGLK